MATMNKKNSEWEKFRLKLEYIKDMVDPKYLTDALGFTITRDTVKELRGNCIIHGGDNPTSFRFNKEKKTWVCFSHKCHEIFGNDVIGLIKAVQNVEFRDAVEYLSNLVGDFDVSLKALKYRKEKERQEFISYTKKDNYVHPEVDEERLAGYMGWRSKLFANEGFSEETLDHFEIAGGYRTPDKLTRDVIPIRDAEGKLVAYSLRDIRANASYESKYWITPGFDKDKVLYNLHRITPVDGPLIVVEGFKGVWRLYDYGIKNVVAVMGSKITMGQQRLLLSHALHGAVIFFDNDLSGATGAMDGYEALKNKMDIQPIFITEIGDDGKGLDPADLGKDTVYGYLGPYL